MTDKKRKQVIFAILVLAVIWGIYNQPWKHYGASRALQERTEAASTAAATAPVMAAAATAQTAPSSAGFATEWTVDPFRSTSTTATPKLPDAPREAVAVPVLQGIMTTGDKPVCVIGGNILKPGDRVGQWRVHTITSAKVELERVTDRRRVTLSAGGTKAMGDGN
ncbi:MAG: hypothetical protein HZB43_04250 [candidate division Zixibacteria bacterium]|nr:hypothetical protein [candidate division Zixibacteria bacterium]